MKRTTTLFATSLDGVSFDKPVLNLVDFNGSKANNILFDGTTAVGIYDDAYNDPNASSRFKCWGNLPAADNNLGYTAQLGGTAVSADGVHWTDYKRFQEPSDLVCARLA